VLSEALSPPPLAEPGERLAILQVAEGRFIQIAPGETPPLRPVEPLTISDTDRMLPFAERSALGAERQVFSVGVPVTGPPLWIVQEMDVAAADARLQGFVTAAILLAVLAVAVAVTAFGAFWWRLANEHSAALAAQFRDLAARIAAQKRLLDKINDTIAEYIGLKAADGTYRYVNPAFAQAIGREVEEAVGLDDAALFGSGTAERLALSDRRALAEGGPVTVDEQVYLGSRLHYLQISKVPLEDESGPASGIVSVARDVTALVEEQKKRERAIQQMVTALVRAVELRDPYLAGHSRRLAGFAVAVAQRLGAEKEEMDTLEIAANLSQIGKLAVPRDILNKPERLTAAEIERMQQHLEHAAAILRDIDFELPVLETVCQMHERLDGGGYPRGLKGDAIRRSAQILGTCDVFCARVEPRAYRTGIGAQEALGILEDNATRYSPEIVAALREVVESVAGEKLVAGLAPE
jgi:PAS domain S-box-containing protein